MSDTEEREILLSSEILEPRHQQAIGMAIWTLLWLMDRCTTEKGKIVAVVLKGRPIAHWFVAEQLGMSTSTAGKHLRKLERRGYIKILSRCGEANAYGVDLRWFQLNP